jgi:hypothetical protein
VERVARKRLWYLVVILIVIAAGLASRRFPGLLPGFLGKYPGDAFWALMVFLVWGLVLTRAPSMHIAAYALVTSYLVEFSQLYHASWIDGIRSTTLEHLVIGSGFSWPDLVAYAVGVAMGLLAERVIQIKRKPRN